MKKIKPNKKQLEAINSKENKVLVLAPAGSGKTFTLVEAIKKYKEDDPDAFVVGITFTRKATQELKNRLKNYDRIHISTIHSWAYTELDNLAQRISHEQPFNSFKIKLLQDDKIKEILSELVKGKGLYNININILHSYVMGNYNMDINEKLKYIFHTILLDYRDFKRQNGLYDFTDLPDYLLTKLKDYNKTIDDIDALFVDEFQDVDDTQLELFERVHAEKKYFIGDTKQSIYIFRGATEDVIKRLKDFTLYELDKNYRSKQEIMDFATTYRDIVKTDNILFSSQLESFRSYISCENGPGGKVYILNRRGDAYEVNQFIKEPGEEVVLNFMDLSPMILCRKNKEVKFIRDKIGYDKVQTVHQAKGLEYPVVIVTDFEIKDIEDINIAYVAMTRAETHLLAANYSTLTKILEKFKKHKTLTSQLF